MNRVGRPQPAHLVGGAVMPIVDKLHDHKERDPGQWRCQINVEKSMVVGQEEGHRDDRGLHRPDDLVAEGDHEGRRGFIDVMGVDTGEAAGGVFQCHEPDDDGE